MKRIMILKSQLDEIMSQTNDTEYKGYDIISLPLDFKRGYDSIRLSYYTCNGLEFTVEQHYNNGKIVD